MKEPGTVAPGEVQAWEQDILIPTYPVQPADPNPMFLEKRVYQGSSGKVYPNPFTDRVTTVKSDKTYRCVMLENEFVRLMILPEIGGRIHIGQDKTNDYDFFYRQHVIKPALVGLLGPWISGGVEFNWPQHHRPTTYMPVHSRIEKGADGSCTVWLSEHEPMNRMKGMVGICLHPGKSLVEAKVRLYNRTPLPQTFLWWANVAVRVHDQYQVFFPQDVTCVADHAKRAMSSFPIARNFYYGVDYTGGVDISWYKNIPVPTSYMVSKSKYDFFGGYDHSRHAGLVHVSNHNVAPGKKLWTWGNAEFGYAWDRNLTDSDGPYVELMAGAYTDNQPDFSWLQPYETKTFSQFWYPIQKIGPVKNANRQAAINLEVKDRSARLGVCTTESLSLKVKLTQQGKTIYERTAEIRPGAPLIDSTPCQQLPLESLQLEVLDSTGNVLLSYRPEATAAEDLPQPATEPPPPEAIPTNEELYLTGLHLEQYRHGTREPETYWLEGLKRDPKDARLNNAMGLQELRRGNLAKAEGHFQSALRRLTMRNPNPYDGEPYYNLGLALNYLGREDEAYDAFYKCTWNYAWQSAGYYALASIDSRRGQYSAALEKLERSLQTNADHMKARGLKATILRRLGRHDEAGIVVSQTLAVDALDFRSLAEIYFLSNPASQGGSTVLTELAGDVQTLLDVAFDYISEGLQRDAFDLLKAAADNGGVNFPIALYLLLWLATQQGQASMASNYAVRAAGASPLYCFPSRLEEMLLLQWVVREYPADAKAYYYLGNLYYDKRRWEEAIECWRSSVALDPHFSIPWRNLGIAQYNNLGNAEAALECYRKAFLSSPFDARLLYEWDQLKKRVGVDPADRKRFLEEHVDLVDSRDDLTVEYVTLLNQLGESQKVLQLLSSRKFSPWEGGEGLVSEQYVRANMILGREALDKGNARRAAEYFQAARVYPKNLGEGKHLLTLERDIDYYAALAAQMAGEPTTAESFFLQAAAPLSGISVHSCYQGIALRQLGREDEATNTFKEIRQYIKSQQSTEPRIDYFATSLPNLLLFRDDLAKRRDIECLFLSAMEQASIGDRSSAGESFQRVLTMDPSYLLATEELRFWHSTSSVQLSEVSLGRQS